MFASPDNSSEAVDAEVKANIVRRCSYQERRCHNHHRQPTTNVCPPIFQSFNTPYNREFGNGRLPSPKDLVGDL